MTPMLLAVPEFGAAWELSLDGWEGEGEQDTPIYMGLSMLADILIGALEGDEALTLERAFSVVDSWFAEGDEEVQNAVAVGLFQDLYESERYSCANPDQMLARMPPVCQSWWLSIND